MIDTLSRTLATAALVAVVVLVFGFFSGPTTPFLAYSVGGAVLVLGSGPRRRDWLVALVLAGAAGFYFRFAGGSSAWLAYLGLGSLGVLGWRAVRSTQEMRNLLLAVAAPLLMIVVNFALAVTNGLHPQTYDLYLYRVEALLFQCQPSFIAGRWLEHLPWLASACSTVYYSLPLLQVAVWVAWSRGMRTPFNPLFTFSVAGVVGFVLYHVLPAVGPSQMFGSGFPNHQPGYLPDWKLLDIDVVYLRNAMPSLHTVWVLLLWWSLRYRGWLLRSVVGVYVLLTELACLGYGEHWAIDLVAAVPLTVALVWACSLKFKPVSLPHGELAKETV